MLIRTPSASRRPSRSAPLRGCFANNAGNEGTGEDSVTTSNAVAKYYYFGGQRVAMRQPNNAVTWLHGDHLGGSTGEPPLDN